MDFSPSWAGSGYSTLIIRSLEVVPPYRLSNKEPIFTPEAPEPPFFSTIYRKFTFIFEHLIISKFGEFWSEIDKIKSTYTTNFRGKIKNITYFYTSFCTGKWSSLLYQKVYFLRLILTAHSGMVDPPGFSTSYWYTSAIFPCHQSRHSLQLVRISC